MKKSNPDQIEQLIITYFDYISKLKEKINACNHKIKKEKEALDYKNKLEEEFLKMLISECTGKGEYHDILLLPYEISQQMKNKNLTQEEQEKLSANYTLALEYSKKIEQRYNLLNNTKRKRSNDIKKIKKSLKEENINLAKYEREYNRYMSQIRRLDNKLNQIKDENKLELKQ